jgi:hypothetical protein
VSPTLAIATPHDGERVARRLVVTGHRATPADPELHAWLLIRAEVEGSRWYPYPGELISNANGAWQAEIDLGGPPNVQHRLVVGTVDPATHGGLTQHVTERPGQPLDDLPEAFTEEAALTVTRR